MRSTSVAAVLIAILPCSQTWGQNGETPPNLKIAFIGDQGLGPDSEAVLRLILAEGAAAVIHAGDLDYDDDPAAWEAQVNAVLGENFPYFVAIGNHDRSRWFGPGGYQDRLEARMERLGLTWNGNLGVLSSLEYQGIFILLVGPGAFLPLDLTGTFRNYVRQQLATDDSIWRISCWHKNMTRMQVGGKPDETGWGVYEASRQGGAIIATGHEHSYSRTHLLASMRNQTVASTDDTLVLSRDDPATPLVDEGRTFAFVNGIGGRSIRDQERCLPTTPPYGCRGEWASIYTSDQGANHGALFGTFNFEGNPRRARFYFKDIAGNVPDEFFVEVGTAAPEPPPPPLVCQGDLNGDEVVDFRDYIRLVQAWNTSDPRADLDGNGTVGWSDVLVLLDRFGPCA